MPVSRQKAEDQSEIGASPPLNGHTLDRTFRAYKEYHTLCSINRQNGTSYEINRERQRTEMLNRKYCDNLRQQQALSGRIEDPRPTQNGSAPPFETEETTFDSAKVKVSPAKLSKENARKNDEATTSNTSSTAHTHSSSSTSGTVAMTTTTPSGTDTRNGLGNVLIKTEPGTVGSTAPCLRSPPPSSHSAAAGSSKVPPSSLTFAPSSSSAASTNGRLGRSFSTPDAKRMCRGNRMSPGLFGGGGSEEMEEEDDLKLKPDVFINNVMKTPPIKALEEGDDPPITPSPTSAGPVTRRSTSNPPTNSSCTSNHSNSNHGNTPSTPTTTGTVSGSNGLAPNPLQMAEDLNEFDRIMEQVYEKESRLSSGTASIMRTAGATSTQIDMYSNMSPPSLVGAGGRGRGGGASSQHVISPPPYNSASSAGLPQVVPKGAARYGGGTQQLHAALTSPPELTTSPPFSSAGASHSLYNPPPVRQQQQQQQPTPSSTPALHQPQAPSYPTTAGPVSMASSQVNMALKFSDHSLQSLPQRTTAFQTTAQQQQQQVQAAGKHPKMLLSHLNHHGEVASRQGMVPTPLTSTITSHMYYDSSQTQPQQAQRHHTSSKALPQPHQTPLTPTAPLGHFTATFPTVQQNAQSSSTLHRSNSLHHQNSLSGAHPHYTYTPETSHFLSSNSVQSPYHQSLAAVAQQRQMMQQQSAALTISTNSWHRQTPQLAYKDNAMMSVHHATLGSRAHVLQQTAPGETPLTTYPPHLRMGQPLHHHTAAAQPPAYLDSNSRPNAAAAFSRLSFPPTMQ